MELRRAFAESLLVLLVALVHAVTGKLHRIVLRNLCCSTIISDFKTAYASWRDIEFSCHRPIDVKDYTVRMIFWASIQDHVDEVVPVDDRRVCARIPAPHTESTPL